MVDAAISESCFNMLDSCVPEFAAHGFDRPPSGSTISGTAQRPLVSSFITVVSASLGRLKRHHHRAAS